MICLFVFFMLKLLQYCKYIIIVMQIKLMLLLLLLLHDSMYFRPSQWREITGGQARRRGGGSRGSNEPPWRVNDEGLKIQAANFQLLANSGGIENKPCSSYSSV